MKSYGFFKSLFFITPQKVLLNLFHLHFMPQKTQSRMSTSKVARTGERWLPGTPATSIVEGLVQGVKERFFVCFFFGGERIFMDSFLEKMTFSWFYG